MKHRKNNSGLTTAKVNLDTNQQELLEKFILNFLPSTGQKRIYPYNSLFSVHRSINEVFKKQVGLNLTERDIIKAFLKLNYGFRTILEPWTELRIPSTNGFYEHVYDENLKLRKSQPWLQEHAIYISVSARSVRELYLSQKRLPIESANKEKTIDPRIELMLDVKKFFGLPEELSKEDFIPKYVLNEVKPKNK
jgi:hypothetical protein